MLSLFEMMLAPYYELTQYASGSAALDGLRRAAPDAVLLDIELGDMSGMQVLQALRLDDALGAVAVIEGCLHGESGTLLDEDGDEVDEDDQDLITTRRFTRD